MMKRPKRYVILGTVALIMLGIGGGAILKGFERESEERETENRDREKSKASPFLTLSDSQIAIQKITFATPGPAALKQYLELPGEITLDAERVVRISPRFAGMVKEVRAGLGENVQKGQVLAVMESNESMSAYDLKAPMAGTLLEKNIKAGEMLKEEDTAFVLADLGSVWVNLHVYPKDLPKVRKGAILEVKGPDGETGKAIVAYVAPVADAETRTIKARAQLANARGMWRPGLFVQARILADSAQVPLTLPNEALQSLDEKPCVFLKTPQGIRPAFVETGLTDGEKVEIRTGLKAGDTVAVGNAYLLKSEFEKASFREDEGDEGEEKDKDRD